MRALYDIDAAILDCVDQETGEILDAEKLDALQMEREQKLEGVALCIKDLKAEAEAVKAEADRLTARKKAVDNKIDGLKNWLIYALDGGRLQTPRCKVYLTHNQRLAVADEPGLVEYLMNTLTYRDQFLKFSEPELKKDAIKKALKDGDVIPGAVLEETESVVIK